MQPVKRSPLPPVLPRFAGAFRASGAFRALAVLGVILAYVALGTLACGRASEAPGAGAQGTAASQARSLPPSSPSTSTATSPAPAPGEGAGVPASRPAAEPAPATGATGVPGEPATNELMPRPQSVRVGIAPPPAPAPARGQRREERELAARERRLAERRAALDARERQLRRDEQSRAGVASGGAAVMGGDRGGSAAGGPGDAGSRAAAEAAVEPGSAAPGTPGDHATSPGAPGPVPAPASEPEERQPTVPITVPAGTSFEVEFTKGLASNTSSVGEIFRARTVSDLRVEGAVAIPAGSEVLGVVTDAVAARRLGGKARLTVKFTDLVLPSGATLPVHASFLEEGKSKAGRDAATIGGSAAGGALLGRILSNGSRGTILGALVGAAVGTAIASKTAGEEVVIPEGSVISLKLDHALAVDARRPGPTE